MATRSCKQCTKSYAAPEERDTGFCSDRCFSLHSMENKPASRLGWFLQLGLFFAGIAVWWWHVEVATAVARNAPAVSPYACRFLAWCSGRGIDRLIDFLGDDGDLRRDALAALEHVGDPADAKKRLTDRIVEVDKVVPKLDRTSRGMMIVALGRAGVVEELELITSGLQEADLQMQAVRALAYMKDPRCVKPLLDLLGQWEWQLKHKPEVIVAVIEALGQHRDDDRTLVHQFLPFLTNDKPVVRGAAALSIADHAADYTMMKKSLDTCPRGEVYTTKQRITRLEKALAAVNLAGETEKDADAKLRMCDAVTTITGEPPKWAGSTP
jgi:hypothetical protein